MAFDRNQNGKFRANPHAASPNAIRIVDGITPGTPEIDDVTIDTSALAGTEVASGIVYTGKDGVQKVIPFFEYQYPDGQLLEVTHLMNFIDAVGGPEATTDKLQKLIRGIVELHEANPEVKVTYTGDPTDTLVIDHVGSGTVEGLVIDGAAVGTHNRNPIP